MPTESVHTPVPVVSCDSHTGPLLEEQLRPYCPKHHLERFDEFRFLEDRNDFTYHQNYFLRALKELHVGFDVARAPRVPTEVA